VDSLGENTLLNAMDMDESMDDLGRVLAQFARIGADQALVADTILRLADAAIDLETVIAKGLLAEAAGGHLHRNGALRPRKTLDAVADEIFAEALSQAPVAVVGTGANDRPDILDETASLAVAIHPLDGWRQVDTNISVGSMFSLLPFDSDPKTSLLQPGHRQAAAGFVIYGPQTCLVLTLGEGTDIYLLDRDERRFCRTRSGVQIPADGQDYAIDAANYRHWDAPIQAYVDDNVAGIDGPRGRNFNMRWIASLVAEAYRILIRGGIYLSPGDRREGYERGCLRLVHEANPLAMVVEQAGGLATDGEDRILDIQPKSLDQCVPLVFGSSDKVERVKAFHDGTLPLGERSPLFGRRGLFRH
jgi:fructose-1,6-bisphosphatase I